MKIKYFNILGTHKYHCLKNVSIRSFLGFFFSYLDWILSDTEYTSILSPTDGKYGPRKTTDTNIYNFIEVFILLYTFLGYYVVWHKEYMIWLVLFSKLSDVLPVFNCARAIGNLLSICLGVSILSIFPHFASYIVFLSFYNYF